MDQNPSPTWATGGKPEVVRSGQQWSQVVRVVTVEAEERHG
jgi:hypothetical protein